MRNRASLKEIGSNERAEYRNSRSSLRPDGFSGRAVRRKSYGVVGDGPKCGEQGRRRLLAPLGEKNKPGPQICVSFQRTDEVKNPRRVGHLARDETNALVTNAPKAVNHRPLRRSMALRLWE
jgi:hypothetical protein